MAMTVNKPCLNCKKRISIDRNISQCLKWDITFKKGAIVTCSQVIEFDEKIGAIADKCPYCFRDDECPVTCSYPDYKGFRGAP